MKLIIGLGNPGDKYKLTRHNIGFLAVDTLKDSFDFDDFKYEKKFDAQITKGSFENEDIILAKPQTFMNLSGNSVIKIISFFKIDFNDLWVIYDDIDLELGNIRIRTSGGPGTHNGMKSIVETLGTNDYPRFRIGIESRGVTSHQEIDISDFVLGKFNDDEKDLRDKGLKKLQEAVSYTLQYGFKKSMDKFNS